MTRLAADTPDTPDPSDADETARLLRRVAAGDDSAGAALLERHRPRLKRTLRVRIDERLAARVDESDLAQETLAAAARRLPEYLRDPAVPFYAWLRTLAQQALADAVRRHTRARRSAGREEVTGLPDRSAVELARRLVSPHSSPSGAAAKREVRDRVRAALDALDPKDREVLVLYHLERMTAAEVGAVLGLSEEAVRSRQRRALSRLTRELRDLKGEFEP